MRKLLKAILHAPKFTSDELYTIFTAKQLMAAKTPFAHALLANDAITGRRISSAFIEAAAIFEDLNKLDEEMRTAWNTVQLQKPRKKDRKVFGADDAVPIFAEIVPDDMSTDDLKKIKDYLKELYAVVRNLISERGDEDDTYGQFLYSITQIEGSVNLKLPLELREPMYSHVDDELEEPLLPDAPALRAESPEPLAQALPEAQALSPDVRDTIAILKNQSEIEKNAIDEAKIIRRAKQHHAKISELSSAYAQQRELTLAYKFNREFKQYKSVLSSYIKDNMETKDQRLYLSCFNQPDYQPQIAPGVHLKVDPIARIAEVINKGDDQVLDAHEVNIKNFAKGNLNFSRAVANYKLIHDAQTRLHPRDPLDNKPEHLVERLKDLYNNHSHIDQSLQIVGDEAVDKATSGIKGFFKKIFSSINWYFSAAGKQEREFKAFAKHNRGHFFDLTRAEPAIAVDHAPKPQSPRSSPAA
jgi:hypothetical protein